MTASLRLLQRPLLPRDVSRVPTLSGDTGLNALADFLHRHRRVAVLTGAGCSTESGIPDYRDHAGGWKGGNPVLYQSFVRERRVRQRYWARSLVGWSRVAAATPNPAHYSLARLEGRGLLQGVITQNVDDLHRRAGSRQVIDLHGRLDQVQCLGCHAVLERRHFQEELLHANPGWRDLTAGSAPDGDARLEGLDFSGFTVPACRACGGTLKPDVVFFGEKVPKARVERAFAWLKQADALLVVGSSLMVWSGYRFARAASASRLPIAALNLGRTRADDLLALKVSGRCGEVLAAVAHRLTGEA